MKQFFITMFGSIIGVLLGAFLAMILGLFLIGSLISAAMMNAEDPGVDLPEGDIVLELDLRVARLDQPSRNPFAFVEPLTITQIVRALERAESDTRVQGLFIRANEFGMSPAQAEELHAAFSDFQDTGRFVIAHAQGFEGTSVTNYFAVSGVEELWLQDTTSFSAVGLSSETPFFGGTFDMFGVQPEFVQFYEYKNAANIYTESDFTEAHREATLSLLQSIFDTVLETAADDRGMSLEVMTETIISGPHSAEEALQSGLVDRLGHVSQARQTALDRSSARFTLSLEDYSRAVPASRPIRPNVPIIALISGQGTVVTGSGVVGFGDSDVLAGDYMTQAIESAIRNDLVEAIVLRIDTPGGSPTASDQIWDAVVRARQAGKPVVISMGSYAASAGYYVSAPADLIVSNATTITGSIGILGGKLVLDEAFNRVGFNVEPLYVGGDYALASSATTPWSEDQRAAYFEQAEDLYEDFTGRVAEGRDLPLERVLEIARGRGWTGEQALELGLVDRIGGLREAISAARELAGLGEDDDYQVRAFPRQPSALEAFQELFGMTAQSAESLARLNQLMSLPEIQTALEARQQLSRPGTQMISQDELPR